MRQAGRGADRSRKWAKGQGQERVTARQDGGQGPSELVLVPTWIRELPELKVDPIFGSLHHDWSRHRDPEGIR